MDSKPWEKKERLRGRTYPSDPEWLEQAIQKPGQYNACNLWAATRERQTPTSEKRIAGQGGVATVINKHPGYTRKADRLVRTETTKLLFPSRAGRNSGRVNYCLVLKGNLHE